MVQGYSSSGENEIANLIKIGFISPAVPGHFNPMSAVARQLQSRNHDVAMICLPFAEPLASAANLTFITYGEKEFPDHVNAEIFHTMGQLKGEEALQFGVDTVVFPK